MRRRSTGRPPRRQPEPNLEVLGRFGRLVAIVIALELIAFLGVNGAFRLLGP